MSDDTTPTPPAGPALDALVAERVMGWLRATLYDQQLDPSFFEGTSDTAYRVVGQRDYLVPPDWDGQAVGARAEVGGLVIGGDVPAYSTDLAAAWLVVERLRADGWTLSLTVESTFSSAPSMAVFRRGVEAHDWPFVCLVNAPEAICRAALAAIPREW